MAHDVFISYASADKATADEVCRALEAAGIRCWIAPRDVAPGMRYAEAIVDAIRAARAMVLIFSPAASESVHVERELDRAVSAGLAVLPLRIAELEPTGALEYYLAGRQWFDALSAPLAPHLTRLSEAVRDLLQTAGGAAAAAATRPGAPTVMPAPTPRRRERRVVSALACELVDLATLIVGADPEDVERLLRDFSDLAHEVITTWGGTVVQSADGAVLAVFGVPVAHENDAEVAVLAGLALVQATEGLGGIGETRPQVHAGVNTGDVLVRFDLAADKGEGFVSGEPLAVATRLQRSAPPMGLVGGATTRALAERVIEFEELEPIAVEGTTEPLRAWLAKGTLPHVGSLLPETRATPFVGRQTEIAFLESLFGQAVASDSPQFALLVGEPGIGKSRLVAELYRRVYALPYMVMWRQGRCLPYGDGVTFRALGEILKAEAGILESDDREAVAAKLDRVLPEDPDREWFRQRLRALLGLEAVQASREENFAAWRRFLEHVASAGPCVLVLEDLHWADEAMLAFIEHVAEQVADVPLFVLATARPELFDAHPGFAASLHRVNRLNLGPLPEADMAQLVAGAGGVEVLSEGARAALVERSGGNPYFAEESVRYLKDNVALLGDERVAEADDLRLPVTVQALISARLDALPEEHRSLLPDAAVIGRVFWSGAVAALGERDAALVDGVLGELAAKQLVRRARTSSMAGESEFVFWHALARDVAYEQLPRAVRAEKHAAAARWIEGRTGERSVDFAEILAHHYVAALDLARAAREVELAESVLPPAVHYLTLAGDRAWLLDVAAAERHYARALEVARPDSPWRSALLVGWAKAVTELGRRAEAVGALEEAIVRLRAEGETRSAALAQMALAKALPDEAEARWLELADGAVTLLEAEDPSPELIAALTEWLRLTINLGDRRRHLDVAERAIALGEQLGLPADARLLVYRGCARIDLGDAGGRDDLLQALEMCPTSGLGEHVALVFGLVGNWLYMYEGFRASLDVCEESLQFARRRGSADWEAENRSIIVLWSQATGDWDRVLDEAVALDALPKGARLSAQTAALTFNLTAECVAKTLVLVDRGRAREVAKLLEWLEAQWTPDGSTTDACVCIAAAAARMAFGDSARALNLLTRSDAALRGKGGLWWAYLVPYAVRIALAAGDRDLAERLAASLEPPLQPLSRHAVVAAQALLSEARGDCEAAAAGYAAAAARWHDFAAVYEEAQALLGQGRCLVALGRAPEAASVLDRAREIFARLGAKPAFAETDSLLAGTRA